MNYFNYNGKVLLESELIIGPTNRGLRYGDGIFETIKLKNGELILGNEHFARLWKGMQALQFEVPKHFTPEKLEEEILHLAKKNKLNAARIRLTIIRGDGGMYDPKNNTPNYIIEAIKLPEDNGPLNINGLQICLFEDAVKGIDSFSNLKTNNYLPYFMGAIFAKQQQCNDALILNSKGNICDSTIANIFFIKEETIYTPALTEGCVAGVMRQWIIDNVTEFNFKVVKTVITKEDLLNAEEVFLSNSIYNIRWVASFENKKYENKQIAKLSEILMRKRGNVYC
ncbi:MAG: aminotransferase class IV [Ferruginibacter sp.]|nr:aminotransferase class IV [Ferruginibacter sp.]